MKQLWNILCPPGCREERTGPRWALRTVLVLTGLGLLSGAAVLVLGAWAYGGLDGGAILAHYFAQPELLWLNVLPGLLLTWLIYLLTCRGWCAWLGGYLPVAAVALVNYFKIQLRSDPLLARDLGLAAEAGNVVGGYTLDLGWPVWLALGVLVGGLALSVWLLPKGRLDWQTRILGAASCGALLAVAFASAWTQPEIYDRTTQGAPIDPWSDVELYVSKGSVYPFLYSVRDLLPIPPGSYDRVTAGLMLSQYEDHDIPADRQISVMGVMLEAFCDLTDFPALADHQGVAQAYAPWHALEEQSVTGQLITNIFGGGTVDTEWAFLTGYTQHDPFQDDTASYVWYFRDQGYQTFGSHPGYGWFYDRENVDRYLGFEEYWFTEQHYGQLVDPVAAAWHSDEILAQELLAQMADRVEDGPCFSFSVSYQNHGPYDEDGTSGTFLAPGDAGLSQGASNILNNYLLGVSSTVQAMAGLAQGLEELDEPVVLVLFGDHKPWAGNSNYVYQELGVSFDISTLQGLYNYYATPYLIWANSAAKQVLGHDMVGCGGDFSPAFLMTELFDQCGWQGPGFMEASRQMRDISPMVHSQGLFLVDGAVTDTLAPEEERFHQQFLQMQYFRQQEGEL